MSNHYLPQPKEVDSRSSVYFDGSSSSTGEAIITEIFGNPDAKIFKDIDSNGTGSFDVSVLIDAFTGRFHTQLNQMQVSNKENMRLRIKNISNQSADYGVSGSEVVVS